MQSRRERWTNTLAVSLFLAAVIYVAVIGLGRIYHSLRQEPFEPMRLERLQVDTPKVERGGTITLLNGVCNSSKDPRVVSVYMAAQQVVTDPLIQATTLDLIGTSAAGQKIAVDSGCVLEEPIRQRLPMTISAGHWRLFVQLTTRGTHGQSQIISMTSNEFEITE